MRRGPIHVVINPAAGQPEPILHELNQVFGDAGVEWSVSVTRGAGDAARQSRRAAERGASIVAAYGGDGTVMEVVNGILDSGSHLGILPGGTGNVLSIELGIPQDTRQAARVLASPESRATPIDVGRCGERHFLLRVGIGYDAKRVKLTGRELRDRYGRLAYFIAALKAIPESKPVEYRLTIDGKAIRSAGFSCLVENAGSIGIPGLTLAPDVDLQDGILDVFIPRDLDFQTLASISSSIAGGEANPDRFRHWRGREISIRADPAQPAVCDGEPCGQTPVEIQVRPKALPVIVPPNTPAR